MFYLIRKGSCIAYFHIIVHILKRHIQNAPLLLFSQAIQLSTQPLSSANVASDVTWEYQYGLEGWAKATSTEMNAEVYHMGGEMRIEILDSSTNHDPFVDSPQMMVPLGIRQHFTLRYRFYGKSKFAKIRLYGINSSNDSNMHQKNNVGSLDVHFPILGDGLWHVAYAEIGNSYNDATGKNVNGTISKIRLWPGFAYQGHSVAPSKGNSFHIDWIRLVRAPVINRVTGCAGEKYYAHKELVHPEHNIETQNTVINNALHHFRTKWIRRKTDHPFASTHNCVWKGSEEITIEGSNFGVGGINEIGAPAHVYIDGKPCKYVSHDRSTPQQRLTCLTPEFHDSSDNYHVSLIELKNGKLPGLIDESTLLQYAHPPPAPTNLFLSNFASRSIDISWQPGGSVWDHMTYTGFIIKWREETIQSDSWTSSIVTGNVTITTIRGLSPNTSYVFRIVGLNEDQNNDSWYDLDLYGRRDILLGALEGPMSPFITGATLNNDIQFQQFNANTTQNYGPQVTNASFGPTGIGSGEGHYGLILIGHANIENCNASSFCCDNYDVINHICSSEEYSYVCMTTPSFEPSNFLSNNNDAFDAAMLPGNGKIVLQYKEALSSNKELFSSPCGPALRLTASKSRQVGAAWYPRQVEVGEGFEANFTFRISNPSLRCNNMDDIYTHCRARGGDGLAFVLQGEGYNALGRNGKGIGYSGINNSLAVEFDTYFNHEVNDPYENHISVHSRGWRHANDENHLYSLGHTNDIPDLTDGIIRIRIKYEPYFDLSHISKPNFVSTPHTSYFFENGNFYTNNGSSGGDSSSGADWGYSGLGLLHVYCENLVDPVLTVPLHLPKTLNLNRGRAWVGFTASTGDETYQVHDILDFSFSSLRLDSF